MSTTYDMVTAALDAAKAFVAYEKKHARVESEALMTYSREMYNRALPVLDALNDAYIDTKDTRAQDMFKRIHNYAIGYGAYTYRSLRGQTFEAIRPRQAFATRVSLMVLESGIQLG
jgi:hypothetical protein